MALRDKVAELQNYVFESATEDEFIEYLATPMSEAFEAILGDNRYGDA